MSRLNIKQSTRGSAALWIVFGLTFFCVLIVVFSCLDMRSRKREAAVPPPVYTGQYYAPEPEEKGSLLAELEEPGQAEYAAAIQQGDL